MSVISIDLGPTPANRAVKRVQHKLAEWLDALVAYPIKNAVSDQELRRVDDDIKRCRELMFKDLKQEGDARLVCMRPARAIRMLKIR